MRNPHRLSASARKEREARATEKGERERERKRNAFVRRRSRRKVAGIDIPGAWRTQKQHQIRGRSPLFQPPTRPLFSPFASPPPPSRQTLSDHPCYTPFPSPFCPFDDAPPQRRHAHSDLIQFPINSQSIDSNSVYRAVGCLPT